LTNLGVTAFTDSTTSDMRLILSRMGTGKKSLHVLVVDDDPTMLALVRRAALQMRMDVWMASSLDEAQQMVLEGKLPDLVITDLMLGDGTGVELVKFLRQAHLPAPTVLVTGSPEELSSTDRALFIDVINKPFRLSALFDALDVARHNVRPRHRSDVHRKARESAITIGMEKASGEDER
jgi:CheY-like chemotaxis protein